MCLLLGPTGYIEVANLEVVPLCVPFGIQIIFEPQVVFDVVHFGGFS